MNIGDRLASSFAVIFICLTFSIGMPILYPIVMLYFIQTYWFDKICLIHFCQKTKVFCEDLPIESTKILKYAIILHFLFGFIMLSNEEILNPPEVLSNHYSD
jgi:hypothetical protein